MRECRDEKEDRTTSKSLHKLIGTPTIDLTKSSFKGLFRGLFLFTISRAFTIRHFIDVEAHRCCEMDGPEGRGFTPGQ